MKNIVIIGGSSGIGLSLAQKLSQNVENSVYCISRSLCPVSGVKSTVTDVRDKAKLLSAIESVPNIDALIYCAGVSLASSVKYVDPSVAEGLIDVNLTCAVLSCKAALKGMTDGGRIILLSSSGGVTPIPFDAPYSASKAGLIKFSEALELELTGTDIKCAAVVIGGVRTRFSFKRKIYDPQKQGDYAANLKSATDALIKIEQTGYTADYVSDKIIKLLHAKTVPPVVTIGVKNKLGMAFYRILPHALKRRVLASIYGLEKSS